MSASFTDSEGTRWDLRLDIVIARRIRDVLGVDLVNRGNEEIERLGRDAFLLVDVIYLVCEGQAKERNITDEQFGRRLAGDPISEATDAFMEALIRFTPSPRRTILATVWSKTRAIAAAKQEAVTAMVNSGEIDQMLTAMMFGSTSSGSPESSASAPTT